MTAVTELVGLGPGTFSEGHLDGEQTTSWLSSISSSELQSYFLLRYKILHANFPYIGLV
jgi:hypothetical protein